MHFDATAESVSRNQPTELYVDDDSAFAESELPAEFTSPLLDTDPAAREAACNTLRKLYLSVTELYGDLELVERALRQSESSSTRAKAAREHIRFALGGIQDDPINGVDRAMLAFSANRKTP